MRTLCLRTLSLKERFGIHDLCSLLRLSLSKAVRYLVCITVGRK